MRLRWPWSTLALTAAVVVVQADLWLARSNMPQVLSLTRQLAEQQAVNEAAEQRNRRTLAELSDLREGPFKEMIARMVLRTFPAGAAIIQEGELGHSFFILSSGEVRVEKRGTQAEPMLPGVEFVSGAYAVADGAAAVVLITEWNEFRALDLGRMRKSMAEPVFVDLRNVYRPHEMTALGFAYSSVGRG